MRIENCGRVDSGFCEKRLSPDHIIISLARSAKKIGRAEKLIFSSTYLPDFNA